MLRFWPTALFLALVGGVILLFWRYPSGQTPPADFEDGFVALERKDYDSSIRLFNKSIDRDSQDAQTFYQRGRAHSGKKAYELALLDYNEAIRLDNREVEYYLGRIILSLFHKRNYDKALEDAKALKAILSENPWPFRILALVHLRRKEHQEALKASNVAVSLGSTDAHSFMMRAEVQAALNQFDEGIKDCNTAMKLDPFLADALRLRGYLYFAKKETAKGLKDLDRAIEMAPLNAEVYSTRATLFFLLNRLDDSLADWNQAIQFGPEDPSYRNGRAQVFLRLRNYAAAIADLDDSIRIGPDWSGGYEGLAYLWSTAPDPQQRDGQKALLYARKALERSFRPNAQTLATLAAAFAELGEFDKAVEEQTKVIAMPTDFLPMELEEARERLELYQAKKPYRDSAHPARD